MVQRSTTPSAKVSPAKQRLSDSPKKTASNSNKRKLTLVLDQQQQSPNKHLTGSRAPHQQQPHQQQPHQHNNPSDTSNLSSKRYRQTTLLQTDAKRKINLSTIGANSTAAGVTSTKNTTNTTTSCSSSIVKKPAAVPADNWLLPDSQFSTNESVSLLRAAGLGAPAAASTAAPVSSEQPQCDTEEGEETVIPLHKPLGLEDNFLTTRPEPAAAAVALEPDNSVDDEGSETLKIARPAPSAAAAKEEDNARETEESPVFNRSDHLLHGTTPTPPPPPPAQHRKYTLADYNKLPEPPKPSYREACVVRRRDDRMALDAHCCPDCEAWFADLSPESRRQRLRQCGRHRDNQRPPVQAPNFFAIEMPPTPEPAPTQCMKFGKRRHRPLRMLAKEHKEKRK
ncbi:hypothetical protein BOX15_Mlig004387g2 [Macrostomum lignano]|uniref:Uncharacterized protein n=1 Tax=Macrostomum lignano TaxID=282301 RepID=A0A267DYF5_9PLAT|nr:hypothetical protein BOX15_Mlig004387g2 [Macrostomum lignano]